MSNITLSVNRHDRKPIKAKVVPLAKPVSTDDTSKVFTVAANKNRVNFQRILEKEGWA